MTDQFLTDIVLPNLRPDSKIMVEGGSEPQPTSLWHWYKEVLATVE